MTDSDDNGSSVDPLGSVSEIISLEFKETQTDPIDSNAIPAVGTSDRGKPFGHQCRGRSNPSLGPQVVQGPYPIIFHPLLPLRNDQLYSEQQTTCKQEKPPSKVRGFPPINKRYYQSDHNLTNQSDNDTIVPLDSEPPVQLQQHGSVDHVLAEPVQPIRKKSVELPGQELQLGLQTPLNKEQSLDTFEHELESQIIPDNELSPHKSEEQIKPHKLRSLHGPPTLGPKHPTKRKPLQPSQAYQKDKHLEQSLSYQLHHGKENRYSSPVSSNHPDAIDYDPLKTDPDLQESRAAVCSQYILFLTNLILWCLSTAFLAVAIYSFIVRVELPTSAYGSDREYIFADLAVVTMLMGSFLFLLTLSGCLGALRQNLFLLKTYLICLVVLFLVNIVVAIAGYFYSSTIAAKVEQVLRDNGVPRYQHGDNDWDAFVDRFHTEFQCCGVSDLGYRDWDKNLYFRCSAENRSPTACAVPYSCCRNRTNIEPGVTNTMCGFGVQNFTFAGAVDVIYIRGCIGGVTSTARERSETLAVIAACVLVFQLASIFLASQLKIEIEDILFKFKRRHPDLELDTCDCPCSCGLFCC